jgi:hypothetical protein
MRLQFSRRICVALTALLCMSGAAIAQSPACNAWRSELASLQNQRGDARAAQAAQRVGGQLAQASNQYRAMGCDRGGFLFFGEAPPPQCGGLRAQIGQLQAQYGALQRQAAGGGNEARRSQLMAAIENNCRPQSQQRGFFDTIFGNDPRRGEIETTLPELEPEQPLDSTPQQPRMGGSYTVCVRSCDGFFFPLANSPGGGGSQDEMCQALCPGTETTAFGMQNGGDIQNAVSRRGTPYASLPNAGKYTRSFDAACTCRAPGESWAQALKEAEYLLDKRKGDIIVTQQRADELSRPRVVDPKRADPKRRGAAPAPAPVPEPTISEADDKPMPSENSPTSGTESAGVGPDTVGERVRDKGEGVKSETRSVTGERRTVRIVAPNLAPNLGPSATRN